jgi:hypothetical protein
VETKMKQTAEAKHGYPLARAMKINGRIPMIQEERRG